MLKIRKYKLIIVFFFAVIFLLSAKEFSYANIIYSSKNTIQNIYKNNPENVPVINSCFHFDKFTRVIVKSKKNFIDKLILSDFFDVSQTFKSFCLITIRLHITPILFLKLICILRL